MSSTEPILQIRDLKRHFPGPRKSQFLGGRQMIKAVNGVNLTLNRGETLGLVGESGCGKSTLAKLIMALDKPTDGEVIFDGVDMAKLSGRGLRSVRQHIQMVMQDPYSSMNPRMTVSDIIGEPFEIHPNAVPKAKRRQTIAQLLELVGLNPDHLSRYPHQFSGGQRQRIGIARALALRPKVVICDEPVSALDVSVQAQVLNLLKDLQAELGLSYLFIAHDLSVVQHVSDRVAVMYLGKIIESGSNQEIFDRSEHPYTQALHASVPVPDFDGAGSGQIVLEGEVPSPMNPPSGCAFRTRCFRAVDACAEHVPALTVREGADHLSACLFPAPLPDPRNALGPHLRIENLS